MNLLFRLFLVTLTAKRQRAVDMWATGVRSFRVLPNDLDVLGHMNNGRYLTVMDLGRMDLMLRSGTWKRLTERGWYPVVAGQTITYRRSLNPFVKYELHTRMLGLDEHGAYLEQRFMLKGEVAAEAYVRARFLKKSGGKVTDEELIDFLGGSIPPESQVPDWLSAWGAQNRLRSHGGK